ncbi:transposase family protein [Rhizobium leguminosarum]|uniref:hypothetical protein n=1 Tax=Rhizobium leguminosarum TaxID=384 RepID=UPI001C978D4B|nr:hypothetical protein [Rhizobium leguminosarum]MBY5447784.1 transposase family protein [Rhizobium leguminosarum]
MLALAFKHEYTRIQVGPEDSVFVRDRYSRATEWTSDGFYFSPEDDHRVSDFITYRDFYEDLLSGAAKVNYGYHSGAATKIRATFGEGKQLEGFKPAQQQDARRMKYFMDQLENAIRANHGEMPPAVDLIEAISGWHADYNSFLATNGVYVETGESHNHRHNHKKTILQYEKPPCLRTVKDKFALYMECEKNILALVRKPPIYTRRRKVVSAESLALWKKFAFNYASPRRPKESHLLRDLQGEVALQNLERKNTDNPMRLDKPGRKAFHRLIKSMDAWWVFARRRGIKAAVKAFRAQQTGFEIWRPGQRFEYDDYMFHLQAILTDLQVWDKFSKRIQDAMSTKRIWLTLGIDACTRYVVAAVPSMEPNSDAVVSALDLSLSDKTSIAKKAGARSKWLGGVRPESAIADNGKPYIANKTEDAFHNSGIPYFHPPKGQPWHRAFVESMLMKFGADILTYFDGQTFVNSVDKGEYDAEGKANLVVEELMALIIRWLVDVYHHEPVAETGETPHNAWAKYIQENRVKFAPTEHEKRHYFGIDFSAVIHGEGLFHDGIRYNSLELNRARQVLGNKKIRYRAHPDNIEYISIWFNNQWVPVRNKSAVRERTSMREWAEFRRLFRERKRAKASENWEIIARARREIREAADSAAARSKFSPDAERPKTLYKLVKQLSEGSRYEAELIEQALKYGLTKDELREFEDFVPGSTTGVIDETADPSATDATPVETGDGTEAPSSPESATETVADEATGTPPTGVAYLEDDEDEEEEDGTGNW